MADADAASQVTVTASDVFLEHVADVDPDETA